MTSKELKASVLFYMLYGLHFMAAVTEYGGVGVEGIADCFGITTADLSHEIEVKVSKQDLAGELAAIKYHIKHRIPVRDEANHGMQSFFEDRPDNSKAVEPPPQKARKGAKHWFYLVKEGNGHSWRLKPNRFSFAVPSELIGYAKGELDGTPYGLIEVNKYGACSCIKKAEYLHKEKVKDVVLRKLLHKTSTEIQNCRAEYLQMHKSYLAVLERLPK